MRQDGMAKIAPLLVLIAATCWGCIGLFSHALADLGLSSIQITVVRCVIAAVCFGLYLLVRDRGALRLHLRHLWMFLGTGIASIAFFNVCYFACIQEANLSLAAILLYTAPCFVTLLSRILFNEPLHARKILALCLAFGGCLLVVGVGSGALSASLLGIALGLGSGVGYALYSIFGRFALAHYSSITVTFYTFLFAALALIAFSQPEQIVSLAVTDSYALVNMLLIGIACTVVPFACYTFALGHMEASRASIMAFVEPMVALLIGAVVFGDALTPVNYLGVALIALAVLALNMPERQSRTVDQQDSDI